MSNKVMSFKNYFQVNLLAREIAGFINRGSATTEKLAMTLREIREVAGIKSLKSLEQSHINQVVEKLRTSDMSLSNKNSYISSINNIVKYLNKNDLRAIKAGEVGLSRNIAERDGVNKENSREAALEFKEWLNQKYIETRDISILLPFVETIFLSIYFLFNFLLAFYIVIIFYIFLWNIKRGYPLLKKLCRHPKILPVYLHRHAVIKRRMKPIVVIFIDIFFYPDSCVFQRLIA